MIVRPSRRDVLRYGGIAAASLLPAPAIAEAWPSKPIRIVCGYPAGGLTDIFARAYGEFISQKTGQSVIVENKAGASGAIAAEQVKGAAPDGYTLMFTISTTMIMNKVLFKKLPYDPDKDFALISWLNAGHLPMIINRNVPAKNVAEFAEYARNNKVSLGTYGAGSYPHVVAETLNHHFGLKMEAVHYRGEALMWQDVASNAIQGGSGSIAGAASVLQTGIGRPIAVPSMMRAKRLPDVPTFYEQGSPSRPSWCAASSAWWGPSPCRTISSRSSRTSWSKAARPSASRRSSIPSASTKARATAPTSRKSSPRKVRSGST
jgi:tripartite-type tricarboxylate transporter receptor subunit TctC